MRQITDLKEIQALALRIFKQFDLFCKEFGVEYFMAYGTLIGTVRHQGFIPWDDDIDVWVKREDYIKIVTNFPEWGRERGLFLNAPTTINKYNRIFAKICMKHTKVETLDRHNNFNEGYFIDIFVLDGSPNNPLHRFLRVTHLQYLRNIVTLAAYGADQLPNPSKKVKLYSIISKLFQWVDQNSTVRKYERIASKSSCKDSNYLLIPIRNSKGRALEMPSAWFESGVRMKYEDMEAIVPIGYDKILRHIFGDYMELPPEDQRKPGHAAKFYIDDDYIKF